MDDNVVESLFINGKYTSVATNMIAIIRNAIINTLEASSQADGTFLCQ